MDFENINQRIGGCGRYQYIAFFLLSLTSFKYSGEFQALTFALFAPKFQCVVETNKSIDNLNGSNYISKDQCKYKESLNSSWKPCSKWTYDTSELSNSFISEFDLVCGREYLREMMFSVYFLGTLGSYPLIMYTDKIGRRMILLIFVFLNTINAVCQTLIYSLWQQFILSFLSGFTRTICTTLAFTTLIEIVSSNKIGIAATNFWVPYSIAYMASALFAYLGRSWRSIIWYSFTVTIFQVFNWCFIPETPRWLMLNQKRERSYKTMLFIAKVNGHQFPQKEFDKWKPVQQATGNFWNLFKYKIMVYRLLISNFAAWSFAFAYIGSSTDLTFASNNIFITTFVMGLVELPACPLAGFLANKFGRKPSLSFLCSIGIGCLILLPFLEADISFSVWQPWLKVIVAMGAKLGFVGAWGIFDIIINETMPTTNRNAAMSLVYVAVGLGSIVAPKIHNMALNLYHALPCLMYATLLIITVVLVLIFIPETHTLPVPQTIEQAVSLIVHKENEWKEDMILQARKLGMDQKADDNDQL